jgi:hypothetical protein
LETVTAVTAPKLAVGSTAWMAAWTKVDAAVGEETTAFICPCMELAVLAESLWTCQTG